MTTTAVKKLFSMVSAGTLVSFPISCQAATTMLP